MIYKGLGLVLAMVAFIALTDPDVIQGSRWKVNTCIVGTFVAILFLTSSILIEVAS